MKKIILFIIFITASLFFILPNQAISSNWKYVGTSKQGDLYLQYDSLKHDGGIATFWYMYVDKNGEVSEVKCSIDCKRRTISLLEYWGQGASLSFVKSYPRLNWIKFPPDSAWDKFYKFLCTESENRTLNPKESDSYGNIMDKVLPIKPERTSIVRDFPDEIQSEFILKKVSLNIGQQNEIIRCTEKVTEEKSAGSKEREKVDKPIIFTIQVGAFKYSSNAQALATRLQGKGYRVEITQFKKRGDNLFRVRLGRFTNIQDAENLSEKIKNIEGLQTFITLL
ncbi:MAG: SPOR domain-containing protein [Thermodesulfovibrionales bacterium]